MSVLCISLMSALLDDFSRSKNHFAPILYKGMTFIIIDCYRNSELREEMLTSFASLFKSHQNIPIQILCEPFLK